MGIYNGPSIYNQGGGGGGGGGYKDGGALVDADFIEVTNNSISTYDNTSRDPINFYFEPAEGEIINAVVQLTTTVNATVNVYILKNGLFVPLGNVGGDTVNAGDQYNVNITGDSFALEQVTGGGADPEAAYINGEVYGVKKYNGVIWTTQNARGIPAGALFNPPIMTTTEPACWRNPNHPDSYYYNILAARLFEGNGWRLPTKDETTSLYSTIAPGGNVDVNNVKSTTGWIEGNGTNSSGFNVTPDGYVESSPIYYYQYGYESYFWTKSTISGDPIVSSVRASSVTVISYSYDHGFSVRLVYDP